MKYNCLSAPFEKNPVLIEPVKQDQRANEREACTELESKSLHESTPSNGGIISHSDFGGLHSITYVSIRGNLYPSPHQEVAREGLTVPPVSPAFILESLGLRECSNYGCLSGVGSAADPRSALSKNGKPLALERPSYDGASLRNFAGNAIVIARAFYSSARSFSGCAYENPSRNDSYMLPGGVCRVRVSSPHVGNNDMGAVQNAAQGLQGENRV